MLLLHGFGSSLETWEPWAQSLGVTYRVVRFDLPGCGSSEADRTGNYGDARSLQIVKALMDALGMEKAVLVGHSMGGRIAWRFAAAFPERTRKQSAASPSDLEIDQILPAALPIAHQPGGRLRRSESAWRRDGGSILRIAIGPRQP